MEENYHSYSKYVTNYIVLLPMLLYQNIVVSNMTLSF